MGWDFYCDPYFNKARVVAEMIKEDGYRKVVDHAVVGNELWRLVEPVGSGKRVIWRDLLKGGGKGSGWGNKDVPYYEGVGCPQRLVDAVIERDERFERWACVNAEARAGKAARAKFLAGLAVGQAVLVYGKRYVLEIAANGYWLGRSEEGGLFRLRKGIIKPA